MGGTLSDVPISGWAYRSALPKAKVTAVKLVKARAIDFSYPLGVTYWRHATRKAVAAGVSRRR